MAQTNFVELRVVRSVFVLRTKKDNKLIATCTLHVDDGMLVGDSKHPEFKEARKKLDQVFNMKEWHDLRKGADYLGAQWVQSADGKTITFDMKQFVDKIISTSPSGSEKDDRLLTPSEVTTFRSLLLKLAWPVRQVLLNLLMA
jgi:hypothetical protein